MLVTHGQCRQVFGSHKSKPWQSRPDLRHNPPGLWGLTGDNIGFGFLALVPVDIFLVQLKEVGRNNSEDMREGAREGWFEIFFFY